MRVSVMFLGAVAQFPLAVHPLLSQSIALVTHARDTRLPQAPDVISCQLQACRAWSLLRISKVQSGGARARRTQTKVQSVTRWTAWLRCLLSPAHLLPKISLLLTWHCRTLRGSLSGICSRSQRIYWRRCQRTGSSVPARPNALHRCRGKGAHRKRISGVCGALAFPLCFVEL